MKPKFGDQVRVTTSEEVIEGVLLQRPEILEGDFTVIKLDNGYNIGIEDKKIKKMELLKEYKAPKPKTEKLKRNPKLPDVSMLSFGGTISSKVDYRTGGVYADYTAEDLVNLCPELRDIANFSAKKIMSTMSEDYTSKEWGEMAKAIAKELNSGAAGVIATQGTDTLHFSTAAMSFMLKNLNKPVVFTASQRSIDRGSSDAFMNLVCATVAASKFDGAEVVSCLHGTSSDDHCILNRGNKVRKMHTSRRDAFRPVNELPLAKVSEDGKITVLNKSYKPRNKGKVEVDDKFEDKTALVNVYPGMDPGVINYYIDNGFKGIVLAATALGHVPVNGRSSLMDVLEKAKKKKVPVVIASQTLYGRTHPYVYTNLRKLSIELSCIFAEDMTPETAYIKLGWVLGHTTDVKKVKELMLTNIAGEINPRLEENSYLY
ncbi:Glu-tRNA(Gln) amidotransferase subunit GatD [Thermoproteota archaeon]